MGCCGNNEQKEAEKKIKTTEHQEHTHTEACEHEEKQEHAKKEDHHKPNGGHCC